MVPCPVAKRLADYLEFGWIWRKINAWIRWLFNLESMPFKVQNPFLPRKTGRVCVTTPRYFGGDFALRSISFSRSNDWWTRLAKCPQIRTWGPWPSQPMLAQGEFPGKKLSASSIQLPAECVCNLSNLILCFCISPHDSFSAAEFFFSSFQFFRFKILH